MAHAYKYIPSPTGQMFHDIPVGTYLYKGIRGVPGSGKTVACDWDIRYKAEMQPPVEDLATGRHIRWSNWGIVRQTYPSLVSNTLKTWTNWFPRSIVTEVHDSPPIRARFEAPSLRGDGTFVRIDLTFLASDAENYYNVLDGLELSGGYVNEAAHVEFEKIHKLQERVGRFKPPGGAAADLKFMSFGVIMDTNTPLETSWWHQMEFVEIPERMIWFVQPPAGVEVRRQSGGTVLVPNVEDRDELSKYGVTVEELKAAREKQLQMSAHECERVFVSHGEVENVREHNDEGLDYYMKTLVGAKPDYIRTRFLNLYGRSKGGLPVYAETWNDSFHCTTEKIECMRGIPIRVGMDFGRNPAAVFGQITPMGQVRVFAELCKFNMSVPHFFEHYFMPFIVNELGWPSSKMIVFGDPSGNNASEMSDQGPLAFLRSKGIPAMMPPMLEGKNNDVDIRIGEVERMLNGAHGGSPDFLISASGCPMLRDGFNGDYRYDPIGRSDRYHDTPCKNRYSHVHDALQYFCCAGGVALSREMLNVGSRFDNINTSSLKMRCRCV